MAGLKRILEDVQAQRLKLGGALSTALIKKLTAYRRRQFWIFVTLEIALVLAVALCALYLVRNPGGGARVQILSSLIGIGAGGAIEIIRRIWKEWSQTDLLVILAEGATEAQLSTILDKLIAKL